MVFGLTNVVERALPFHKTTDSDEKPDPVMMTVAPAAPAGLEFGLIAAMTGMGARTVLYLQA